jgi:hypothetical protein
LLTPCKHLQKALFLVRPLAQSCGDEVISGCWHWSCVLCHHDMVSLLHIWSILCAAFSEPIIMFLWAPHALRTDPLFNGTYIMRYDQSDSFQEPSHEASPFSWLYRSPQFYDFCYGINSTLNKWWPGKKEKETAAQCEWVSDDFKFLCIMAKICFLWSSLFLVAIQQILFRILVHFAFQSSICPSYPKLAT